MLERSHISSNSSSIELENFEFKHLSNSKKMNFSCLNLSFERSLPSFGTEISSISNFIKFVFLKQSNFWVSRSSFKHYLLTRLISNYGYISSYLSSVTCFWKVMQQSFLTPIYYYGPILNIFVCNTHTSSTTLVAIKYTE